MLVKNEPTDEGRLLGGSLARLVDKALAAARPQFAIPERCASCAFRRGTYPNGCPVTVMDALKCVMEGIPFDCHSSPIDSRGNHTGRCAGWIIATASLSLGDTKPLDTPWEFSK